MSFETPSPDTAPPVAESRLRGIPVERLERHRSMAEETAPIVGGEAVMGAEVTLGVGMPEPSKPQVINGDSYVRLRAPQMVERLGALEDKLDAASDPRLRSWARLLSGDIPEVSGGGVHPRVSEAIKRAGVAVDIKRSMGHKVIDTGAHYDALKRDHPTERYQFYHSFADSDAATDYLADLLERANERGISISLKTYDHAYDGINVYTYHFKELQEIIQEIYNEHQAAWGSTEHFLQGPIEGVDPNHIGWVQEPVAGLSHLSHSGRMGRLGAVIDAQGLNEGSYLAGCAAAGVRPDTPWLLSREHEGALIEEAREKHAAPSKVLIEAKP